MDILREPRRVGFLFGIQAYALAPALLLHALVAWYECPRFEVAMDKHAIGGAIAAMTIYKKLVLLGLSVVALASVGTPSAANPTSDQFQLSSGGTTITITDNGLGDVSPLIGTIAYANPNLNSWEITLTGGTSSSPGLRHLVSGSLR